MQWIYGVVTFLAACLILFVVIWSMRAFNNAATRITVEEVEPGVHCALATSSDGVAVDCWSVE